MSQSFDADVLLLDAATRWLRPSEVYYILQNHERIPITTETPKKPPSGSIFLYNRRVNRFFRRDGHLWRRKKDGRTIAESHERIKVGNVDALSCYYTHCKQNPCFQRRCFWMLKPEYEHIVLVQYRDVSEGRYCSSLFNGPPESLSPLRYPNSIFGNQWEDSTSSISEDNESHQSSSSFSCITEVSLGDDYDDYIYLSQAHMDEYLQDSQYQPPGALEGSYLYTQPSAAKRLCLGLESSIDSASSNFIPRNKGNSGTDTLSAHDGRLKSLPIPDWEKTRILTLQSNMEGSEITDSFSHYRQLEPSSEPNTTLTFAVARKQWFTIREIAPEWAFSYETTKVIISGDFLCDSKNLCLAVMFGDSEVPVEIVLPGVLRCYTPRHRTGKLTLCITSGNTEICSEFRDFEFREKTTVSSFTDIAPHSASLKSNVELLVIVRFVRMLFCEDGSPKVSVGDPQSAQCLKFKMNDETWVQLIDELKRGSNNTLSVVDSIVEEMLKSKLRQWLLSTMKLHGYHGTDCALSKYEQGIIHLISALGYEWALSSVLRAGVSINFHDANGWSALHWAAYFGREKMVAALLAAGASATAVTDPTVQDPVGKTAAFLACEQGHTGLAGYLSEVSLTSYLASLAIEESDVSKGSAEVEADRAVESISQRSAQLHGGTEDELSMKDSLAAVRNAAQAAARIQNVFRAFSFKERKEKTAQRKGQEDIDGFAATWLYRQAHASSNQLYDKAAVSIQRKYKGWKARKHFLNMRRNVVKIQAHVRGHQVRKKCRTLLSSVSVLEKVILRWRRKRLGLRGFRAKQQPMVEAAEDIDEPAAVSRLYQQTHASSGHAKMQVEVEEPYSTPYKDVMAWFAIGKQRRKGLNHTCMQQAGHKLLGRDDIRQKVKENILLDRNVGSNCTVIWISGESGFGKTSLLHVLYNDQELIDAFDKRIWIQISDKLDILMFYRKIIEFAMNDHCSIMNIDLLRELVMEEITDKKFLLFLDDADMQDQQCWTSILEVLNAGAKDSAVVMATSSTDDVLRDVATHSYFLNPLPEESNMMILQQYSGVGTDIQSNPDLVMISKRLISRFGSNPLNLKSICGLLCHADTVSLDKDKFEGSVMPLQLCHDVLPHHLKKCLALCSLFPEGYIFDKHHMVLLWISHGCVRPVEGYELEDVGVEYFNELLCRSFFQCSPVHIDKDDMFVRHELMYNVVASVSRDKYFKSKDLLSSIPENVLHCSLISSRFQTVELMHRTEQLKDLQTFLVVQPEWKPNYISLPTLNLVGLDDFLLKFTSLEILDLSHTETEELPGSIAGLKNLRYLSVSNTNIKALPSELCSLSNMQTLEAKHCRFLTELPRDMRMLVNLRHLDLTKELGYVDLPRGIGELTELQTLPVFHVSGDLSHCSISELGNLQSLRGCLWLSGLGSVKTGSKAQEANLKDKHRLKDLTLQWHDAGIDIEDEDEDTEDVADEQVLESLQPHANLQVLTIRGYEGSRFPAWMQGSSPSLPNLVTLTLDSCCNCTEFPAIAQLPSLKSLSVRKMYDVRRLSSNNTDTHGDGVAKFPSLELLNLWEMYGLEELFLEESQGDYCPRLRKVCISRCPDLKRLPRALSLTELILHCGQQLPDISELASLASLKIEGFHGVTSFGLPAAAALKKLEIRSCKELSSVDGLSALSTVRRLKIARCPKLVLPGTSSLQTT